MQLRGGNMPKSKPSPPKLYEWTWEHEALSAVFLELQAIVHAIQNQNAKKGKAKDFKPVRWPTPKTAADLARREERKQAFSHFQDVIKFEPTDTWLAKRKRGGH